MNLLASFRPFDKLRAVPSIVEGRLKPEATLAAILVVW
jgi:hypothetical protein